MITKQLPLNTSIKKMILGFTIFITTLLTFGLAVDKIWYREDDLGQIINGIIRSKKDLVRVFTSDEREFIVPVNFKRSKANFISGFLRPLKNIFFTGIYSVWGLNVKAFYWHHVVIHALNAFLFFWLLCLFVPLWLSALGGFLFSFYPDNAWLVWIAATHNSLSTVFLLLALLLYHHYFFVASTRSKRLWYYGFSGFLFLLSLLSRENAVFFPFWIFAGVWLYHRYHRLTCWRSFKNACSQTWVFFAVNVLYTVMRLGAFGIQTLDRTIYNLSLRFPFITKILPNAWVIHETSTVTTATQQVVTQQAIQTVTQVGVTNLPATPPPITPFFETILNTCNTWADTFFSWSSIMFCMNNQTTINKAYIVGWWLLLIIFIGYAYKNHYSLLLFFIIGFYCFSWQAFVAYPAARYINSAYPIIIAIVIFGIYFILTQRRTFASCTIITIMLTCTGYSLITGIQNNISRLNGNGTSMIEFEQRYARLFAQNSFPKGTNFILLGSPFVSDIQNIFQYFMNDFDVKLAHEIFATVAEHGYFGCRGDYHSKGVPSHIEPIPEGFRFISNDPDHCCWWMHFSDHPIRWSAADGAYRWSPEKYRENVWYDTSLGSCKINKRIGDFYVVDISFKIDKKWLDKNTVIISWDTMKGEYIVLDASHLIT